MDLILHPLRSELNFPIGAKVPLDLAAPVGRSVEGLRWELPSLFIDALLYGAAAGSSLPVHRSQQAADVGEACTVRPAVRCGAPLTPWSGDAVRRLQAAVSEGCREHHFTQTPHLGPPARTAVAPCRSLSARQSFSIGHSTTAPCCPCWPSWHASGCRCSPSGARMRRGLGASACLSRGARGRYDPAVLSDAVVHRFLVSKRSAEEYAGASARRRGRFACPVAQLSARAALKPERQSDLAMKLLNLVYEWLHSLLPAVLSCVRVRLAAPDACRRKVNRVSFGLLTADELAKWWAAPRRAARPPARLTDCRLRSDPAMPPSRRVTAVPFVGKDVPSAAAEFSHPDMVIGLTALAYRWAAAAATAAAQAVPHSARLGSYQGMREDDLRVLLRALQRQLMEEEGPYA